MSQQLKVGTDPLLTLTSDLEIFLSKLSVDKIYQRLYWIFKWFKNYFLLTGPFLRILPEVFLVCEVRTRKTEGYILPVRSRASES